MKYFSMFSGIGGFEHGIENIEPGFDCVGYSEIDKYATAIYQYHYSEHKNYGNAKDIVPEEIPDFELLVGGFPCQAFSVAGKRGGFDDTRGTLFFDVARVLKAKRPDWFLLENVKGLCSHDSGKTLGTIYKVLTDLDYTVGWEVVNSCQFGVPQNRERIFIVGHLTEAGGCVGEILPVGESEKTNHAENLKQSDNDIAGTLNCHNNSPRQCFDSGTVLISDSGNSHKFEEQDGVVPTLRKGTASGYHNYLKENYYQGDVSGKGYKSQQNRIYYPNKLMCTIPSSRPQNKVKIFESTDKHGARFGTKIRRLTPVECERLQGFPDGWTEYGVIDRETVKISDTQRYKVLGNTVTVDVIEAFMEKMIPIIQDT